MLYGIDPKPGRHRICKHDSLETDLDKALADPAVEGVILPISRIARAGAPRIAARTCSASS
jgi:hypothetical protein